MAEPEVKAEENSKDKDKEKDLRKKYEGKEIALVAENRVMWSSENNMDPKRVFLTHNKDPKSGKPQNVTKIPKGVSINGLKAIDKAVESGVLQFVKDLNEYQEDLIGSVVTQEVNEDSVVKEMENIDYLLHLPVEELEKELSKLEKEKASKAFFKTLLAEEKANKARESYIEAIADFT